jgi:hypothetical protein
MALHDLMGYRSVPHYKSPYTGTTNHKVHTDYDYNDTSKVKREHRSQKSAKRTKDYHHQTQVDARALQDEYVSKAQEFVERNKAVIDSGSMFQTQPLSKAKLRF